MFCIDWMLLQLLMLFSLPLLLQLCENHLCETECESETRVARRQLVRSKGHAEVVKVAHKTRQEEKPTDDIVLYQHHYIDSCPEALVLDLSQRIWCWREVRLKAMSSPQRL